MTNKKLLTLILLLFLSGFVFSQTRPDFFPDNLDNSRELGIKCYCKPGLSYQSRSRGAEFVYQYNGARTYRNTEDMQTGNIPSEVKSSYLLSANIKVPLLNKEQYKLLLSFKHTQERFNLSSFGQDFENIFNEFGNANFKHSAIGVIFSHSYNEYNYIAVRGRYVSNGNYARLMDFDSKYSFYNILAFWGRKKTDNLEWGAGVRFGKNIEGENRIIPFIVYNRNFSDKWGIESVLPSFIFLRYNPSLKTILFAGIEIESQNFAFDLESNTPTDPNTYIFDYSRVLLSASVEKKIIDWVWFEVKAGFAMPFNSQFDSVELPSFEVDPNDYFAFKFGLFISPPDEFFK